MEADRDDETARPAGGSPPPSGSVPGSASGSVPVSSPSGGGTRGPQSAPLPRGVSRRDVAPGFEAPRAVRPEQAPGQPAPSAPQPALPAGFGAAQPAPPGAPQPWGGAMPPPQGPFAPSPRERFIPPPGPEPMPPKQLSSLAILVRYVAIWAVMLVLVLVGMFVEVFVFWPHEKAQAAGFIPYLFLLASPVMASIGVLVALPFINSFTRQRACLYALIAFVVLGAPVTWVLAPR